MSSILLKRLKGFGRFFKVRFYRFDLQGMCDSLVYEFNDSTISLYQEPILWSDENQLTAELIDIVTENSRLIPWLCTILL